MPTFKEVFGKLAVSSPGDFHEVDEFTRVHRDDVMLQLIMPEEDSGTFNEPWVHKFPDPKAYKYDVHVMYGGSRIHAFLFISVDGGRYMVPIPTSGQMEIDELQYTLARIIQNTALSIDDALKTAGIKVVKAHRNSLQY